MSWTKPGKVSAAERLPPPTVSRPSTRSTRCPAWARVIAAASPLGPAPTTTASYCRRPASRRSATARLPTPAQDAQRRAHHIQAAAQPRVLPDILGLRPLQLRVDAHHLHVDPLMHAEVRRQGGDGLPP